MMKLRLAQPKHLVDLRKVPGLTAIKEDKGALAIGAMTTHWQVESSALVKSKTPVLSEIGGHHRRSRRAQPRARSAARWLTPTRRRTGRPS